jgi:hypothetical protein
VPLDKQARYELVLFGTMCALYNHVTGLAAKSATDWE